MSFQIMSHHIEPIQFLGGAFLGLTAHGMGEKLIEKLDKNLSHGLIHSKMGAFSSAILAAAVNGEDYSTAMKVGLLTGSVWRGAICGVRDRAREEGPTAYEADEKAPCLIGMVAGLVAMHSSVIPAVLIGSMSAYLIGKCDAAWRSRLASGAATAVIGAIAVNPMCGALLGGAVIWLNAFE